MAKVSYSCPLSFLALLHVGAAPPAPRDARIISPGVKVGHVWGSLPAPKDVRIIPRRFEVMLRGTLATPEDVRIIAFWF